MQERIIQRDPLDLTFREPKQLSLKAATPAPWNRGRFEARERGKQVLSPDPEPDLAMTRRNGAAFFRLTAP
jgi:hypothetical protein